jgi:hypothetical protein
MGPDRIGQLRELATAAGMDMTGRRLRRQLFEAFTEGGLAAIDCVAGAVAAAPADQTFTRGEVLELLRILRDEMAK